MEVKETIMNEIQGMELEEVVTAGAGSSNLLKVGGGLAVIGGLGFVGYKYIAKPVIKKIKAKKAEKQTVEPGLEAELGEVFESNEN